MLKTSRFIISALGAGFMLAASAFAEEPQWISLFNGKDLTGWTIKIAKQPLGVNFADTFQVEDGILKVFDGIIGMEQLKEVL